MCKRALNSFTSWHIFWHFKAALIAVQHHEFNYCLFCWLADWMSVCVRSVLTGITIKYTQHSDMWQNYKTKLFFSLQHLRWIHNPPKQKSSKTAVCTRRTVYLWIGYDLTVDDHLYASYKPKQKTRTIREARLYGTQRHKKNMKWINYTYFKACSHKLTH